MSIIEIEIYNSFPLLLPSPFFNTTISTFQVLLGYSQQNSEA